MTDEVKKVDIKKAKFTPWLEDLLDAPMHTDRKRPKPKKTT